MSVLNKYIAHAGYCSRRKAVEFIKGGLVTINGRVERDPSYQVEPGDDVRVHGKHLKAEEKVYILLNKPNGYITTVSDERGRKTVMDLVVEATRARIYPVGRLDRSTTGLLVLTNDGELVQRLAHPKYQVQKTYYVTVDKEVAPAIVEKIERGVQLMDGKVKVDSVGYLPGRPKSELQVTLHSGKYRVIRRLFEHLGYEVVKLDRVRYAGLTKQGLPIGRWRYLKDKEVASLKGEQGSTAESRRQ